MFYRTHTHSHLVFHSFYCLRYDEKWIKDIILPFTCVFTSFRLKNSRFPEWNQYSTSFEKNTKETKHDTFNRMYVLSCYLKAHSDLSLSHSFYISPSLLILKHIMFILQNNRFKCFFFLYSPFLCFISYCSLSYEKTPKFALKMCL